MESKVKLTFSPDTSGFSKELGRRGRKYIKSCKGGSRHANFGMYIKSIFMALLFFVPPIIFYTVLDHSNPTFWTFVLWGFLAFLTGMGKAGNGEGTMHDSNHHSYFKDDSKNTLLGNLVMNVSGTLAWLWRLQHNFFHHTFTNVHGYDHDLEAGRIMRFAKEQPWKWWHRLQFIYAPFLYGLMSLTWLFIKDGPQMKFFFKKLEEKGEGVSKIEKKKLWKKLWAVKISYVMIWIVLPMVFSPVPWYFVLAFFAVTELTCGWWLAFTFQPAHIRTNVKTYKPEEVNLPNYQHQMATTSDFATKRGPLGILFSWLIGGLNFQVEHHLWPNVGHRHYRKLRKIRIETCKDFNIPYEKKDRSFIGAVIDHLVQLYRLGNPKFT